MRVSRIAAAAVVLSLALMIIAGPVLAEPQRTKTKPQPKPQGKIFIPDEVKAVLQEGLATRQGRQDIPFSIVDFAFLPAQGGLYSVFFFKVKNADLPFGKPSPAAAATAPVAGPDQLQARFNVFLQFLKPDQTGALKPAQEVYVPASIESPAAEYSPEKVEWYSFGYPLPSGKYTLAMAVTSLDLKTVGVAYQDFALPDPSEYQNGLETSPVLLINELEQIQTDTEGNRVTLHKGWLKYSVLRIVPNIERVVQPGATVETFFFVFGAGAKPETGKPDIEVEYSVQDKEAKPLIKWQIQNYDFILVDQQLPLKKTVIVKDDKGERTEQRDLLPGPYDLVIKVKDKVTGNTVEKMLPFEVK